MRVSEDRYARDLRRLELARRMVRYRARTRSILEWSGLSVWRVRLLYRQELGEENELNMMRHRGPRPQKLSVFYNSPGARSEAGALTSSFRIHSVIPVETGPLALKHLPGLERGERLCDAYQGYVMLVPAARYTFDHAVVLLRNLVLAEELVQAHCLGCQAVLVVDRLVAGAQRCDLCRRNTLPGLESKRKRAEIVRVTPEVVEVQQSLF